MNGKLIFTDNEYNASEYEVFESPRVFGSHLLKPSEECTSNFLGFGVAITPSSCYQLSIMEPSARKQLLKKIYSKDGIGLSVGRLCIGSSDYSPEIYTYDDVEGDRELAHFSIARDEKYVIPMIKEILEIKPDLYLFASPWSPPHWMKTGASICGGYMRNEFVDCYAEYIIKFIKAYAKHGIKISAITPQNEANTQHSSDMPCCIWHPETEAEFIRILKQKLTANALDTKIWMFDHNFNDVNRVLWSLENCSGLKDACDGVAFHYYAGTVEQTVPLKKQYPELCLHFTEGGPRLTDNYSTDWCKWGLMIVKALKAGYSSFTGWNLMLDEMGGPSVGPYTGVCGGLVTRNSQSGELDYSGQYKAFSHIAPYITKTSKIYPLYVGETLNPEISKYPKCDRAPEGVIIDSGDGRKLAVVINPNSHSIQTQIELCNKLWYVELRAESISTIIIE